MNADRENVQRSSTMINTHRLSPVNTQDASVTASLTQDEPSGSGSSRNVVNGLHKRAGGAGKKNGVGYSHANGHLGHKGSRSASPVASSSLAPTSSASAPTRRPPHSSTVSTTPNSSSTIPAKRKHPNTLDGRTASDEDPESIRCICGFTIDDGWSVGCDGCGRWVHGVCFGFEAKDKENLPDRWWCWECDPSLLERVDRDQARSLQIARLAAAGGNTIGNGKQRTSPGVEKKARKISTASNAGSSLMHASISTNTPLNSSDHSSHKRKRTAVVAASPLTTTSVFPFPPHTQPSSADDYADIDKAWSHSFVDISHDVVPQFEIRERLRKQAAEWRGVSAISPVQNSSSSKPGWPYFDTTPVRYPRSVSPSAPPVSLRPLNPSPDSVLPPSYAVHTTHSIPSQSFLAPYPSVITSSSTYLQDPLNAYATLGMPKPRVHLMGPPLDISLDARGKGGKARYVRSGCRPNAVLRPVLCDGKANSGSDSSSDHSRHHNSTPGQHAGTSFHSEETAPQDAPETSDSLSFAIFALRDLKAEEEIVLGWEWDDANVVHLLPALLQDKGLFPPTELAAYKLQMANILRALGATFTSCACGERAQGCVMRKMKEFVDEIEDWELLEHGQRGYRAFATDGSGFEESTEAESEQVVQDAQGNVDIQMQMNASRFTADSRPERLSRPYTSRTLHSPSHDTTSTIGPSTASPAFNAIDLDIHQNSTSSLSSGSPSEQTSNTVHVSHPQVRSRSNLNQQARLEEEGEVEIATIDTSTSLDPSRFNGRTNSSHSHLPRIQFDQSIPASATIDLGPLIGVQRGFRTREKVPGSGGLSGVEMDEQDVDEDQDGQVNGSVRLGPREDKKANSSGPSKPRMDYGESMIYNNQRTFPPPDHIFPPYGFLHPYAIHGIPPFPLTISPYGPLYGTSYHSPYTQNPPYDRYTDGLSSDSRRYGRDKAFWGEIPPSTARLDKGKERVLDSHDVVMDGGDNEPVDVEGNDEEAAENGTASSQQPKRHQRKRSVHQRRRSPPIIHASHEVVEECEMPPKMKRRWINGKKEHENPVGDQGVPRALEDMEVHDEGHNRDEQGYSPVNDISNRKSTASPALPAISTISLQSPSNTSPLLSFANLSLLSPAVSIPTASTSTFHTSPDRELLTNKSAKPITANLWDTPSAIRRDFRHRSVSPRPRSRSNSQSSSRQISNSRRIITDPLAALAAAAAAARPISPLPNSTYSKSRRTSQSRSPHFTHPENRLGISFVLPVPNQDTHSRAKTTTSLSSSLRRQISIDDVERSDTNHRYHVRGDFADDDQDIRRSRELSQASEILENHDAVLGPGGIRVLSSPEHEWLPLRRSNTSSPEVSSYGVIDGPSALRSMDHSRMTGKELGDIDDSSLEFKQELLEAVVPSPIHFSHNVSMNAEPISQPRISTTIEDSDHAMQIDTVSILLASPVHRSPLLPLSVNEHQRLHLPTDSHVALLSPLTPPTKNLDEIPPWPASPSPQDSPSASVSGPSSSVITATPLQGLELLQKDELSLLASVSASYCAPTELEPLPLIQPQSVSSPMMSSVQSPPPFGNNAPLLANHAIEPKKNGSGNGVAVGENSTKSSSPLSSPLSSPMERLRSLPTHSAPLEGLSISSDSADRRMEMNLTKAVDLPLSTLPATPVCPSQASPDTRICATIADVPDLEHSTSTSPLRSAGNISPATPRDLESDAEAMEVDSLTVHDTDHNEAAASSASINADSIPPSATVQTKINGEHVNSSSDLLLPSTSTLTPQAFTTPLADPPTPTISAAAKVKKISLKDFAIRKRRQKEEEQREKEEKEKELRNKTNELDHTPADQEKDTVANRGSEEISDSVVEVGIAADAVGKEESMLHSASSDPDTLSASFAKPVHPPTIDLDHNERNHPKSDADVIMKASETLSKLVNSSTVSSTSATGLSDHPHSSVASLAVANTSPAVSISPATTIHMPSGLVTEPSFVTHTSRLGGVLHPSLPETFSTSVGNHSTFPGLRPVTQSAPEDGEIEDGDNRSMIKTSSPMHFSSSNVKSSSSYQPLPFVPKSSSPPPRIVKFHDTSVSNEQRSRTPPTQPRSFSARSPSITFYPNGSPPIRSLALANAPAANASSPKLVATALPTPPALTVPSAAPPTNPALGRTPPSGPRALRQMHQQHNGVYQGARTGSAYIPRGVPYDSRERDRFRDRGGDFIKDRDRDRDLHWNGPGAPRIRTRDVGGWAR